MDKYPGRLVTDAQIAECATLPEEELMQRVHGAPDSTMTYAARGELMNRIIRATDPETIFGPLEATRSETT